MAMENKIKFAMGVPQAFVIASWEQTQFGMKYNTADGRFFDASKGLTDLLSEMNLAPNTQVTIEKKSNPGATGQDYGKFYVNGQCIDDVRSGVAPQGTQTPQVAQPPATQTATASQSPPPTTGGTTEDRLANLESRVNALEQNKDLPF